MSMSGDRPKIDPEGYYNQADAARLLGIHVSTLKRWRKLGRVRVNYERDTKRAKYSGKDLLDLFYI